VTSTQERLTILEQNELAKKRGSFQKLRRCCICVLSSCVDKSACGAEFDRWTKQQWDAEVEVQRVEVARRKRLRPWLRWSRIYPH